MKSFADARLRHRLLVLVGWLAVLHLLTAAVLWVISWHEWRQAVQAEQVAGQVARLYAAASELAFERGQGRVLLSAVMPASAEQKAGLLTKREAGGRLLDEVLGQLMSQGPVSIEVQALVQSRADMGALRRQVDVALSFPKEGRPADMTAQWVSGMSIHVQHLVRLSEGLAMSAGRESEPLLLLFMLQERLWHLREAAGRRASLLSSFVASGQQVLDSHSLFLLGELGGQEALAHQQAAKLLARLSDARLSADYAQLQGKHVAPFASMLRQVVAQEVRLNDAHMMDVAEPALSALAQMLQQVGEEGRTYAAELADQRLTSLWWQVLIIGLSLVLYAALLWWLHRLAMDSLIRFRWLAEEMPQALLTLDGQGRIVAANAASLRLLDVSLDAMMYQPLSMWLPVLQQVDWREQLAKRQEWPLLLPVGVNKQVRVVERVLSGESAGVMIMLDDVTQVRLLEHQLQEKQQWLEMAESMARLGHWVYDIAQHRLIWSTGVFQMHAWREDRGQPTLEEAIDMLSPKDRQHAWKLLEAVESGHQEFSWEAIVNRADGQQRRVRIAGRKLEASDKLFGIYQDVTALRLAEEDLRRSNQVMSEQLQTIAGLHEQLKVLAERDGLTGLLNRRQLDELLPGLLTEMKLKDRSLSVIMMDMDHFKRINDTYGHRAGDAMLKAFADLIRAYVRGEDMAFRFGGEEFVLLMPKATLSVAAERAEQLRQAFAGLVVSEGGYHLNTTLSLGVAAYPDHGAQADELLRLADTALYAAKAAGRNRVCVYRQETAEPDAEGC